MKLPPEVRAGVESALEARVGRPVAVQEVTAVGGGCISPTARLRTDTGDSYFLKWGAPNLPDALMEAEARGLRHLGEAGAVRVPVVIATAAGDGPAWLLLEWLEPGSPSAGAWERLGRELASLHRSGADQFGSDEPNFIGSLPQNNEPAPDWAEFWRDRRLKPQLDRTQARALLDDHDRRRFDHLFDRLPGLLQPGQRDGPSLLHGDLWSGNVHILEDGTAALVDPSVYYGHREVDLAMAELFGGFESGFRTGYEESWSLTPGYEPVRRAIYQLYYLLVHVNLFGASYVPRTRSALSAAGV